MKRYLVFTNKYRSVFRCFLGLDTCSLLKLILVMKNSDSMLSTVLTCVKTVRSSTQRVTFVCHVCSLVRLRRFWRIGWIQYFQINLCKLQCSTLLYSVFNVRVSISVFRLIQINSIEVVYSGGLHTCITLLVRTVRCTVVKCHFLALYASPCICNVTRRYVCVKYCTCPITVY